MRGVREDYPPPAYQSLMNLVDSHDTARILWTLTPGEDNAGAKSEPEALAEGKAKLRLVSTIQLTFPGMASIYYGDEVGLSGFDDPDDRRPYPWGVEDLELREHYRTLARLRASHEAIREGDLEFLVADDAGRTLAYLRRSPAAAAVVALNLGERPRQLDIDVTGRLPDGVALTDAIGGREASVVDDGRLEVTLEPMSVAVLVSPADADLAAPPAPTGLRAEAGSSRVDLAWDAVPEAAGYQVWRSLVAGGGYELVAETEATSYTDTSVRDGARQFYVVTAVDGPGNVSARSAEVSALPQLVIEEARLLGLLGPEDRPVDRLEQELSAIDGAVEVEVAVTLEGEVMEAAAGVLVETGLGPGGSDPDAGGGVWTWSKAAFVANTDREARYRGLVQPETLGELPVAARVSTDGAATWQQATGSAVIQAVPGEDVEPPSAPGVPQLRDVSADAVGLRWVEPATPDLLRYLVLRAEAGPDDAWGDFEVIGRPDAPVYRDASVVAGTTYRYAVQAQDISYNISLPSATLEVVAERRSVPVTFSVAVPGYSPPTDTIFIAGDFQGWDPGATPLERLADGRWAITIEFEDGTALEYKYTRGSWEAVEKDSGCGEIPNRALTVEPSGDGAIEVEDTVEKWRDLDACG